MSNNGLSQPGSSTYSSNTMYVGDGTWDSERNTFLLPNLMSLNFDTMRYNGKLPQLTPQSVSLHSTDRHATR